MGSLCMIIGLVLVTPTVAFVIRYFVNPRKEKDNFRVELIDTYMVFTAENKYVFMI